MSTAKIILGKRTWTTSTKLLQTFDALLLVEVEAAAGTFQSMIWLLLVEVEAAAGTFQSMIWLLLFINPCNTCTTRQTAKACVHAHTSTCEIHRVEIKTDQKRCSY